MKATLLRALTPVLVMAGIACVAFGIWQEFGPRTSVSLPRWGGSARIVAVPPELEYRTQAEESTATIEVALRNEGQTAGKLLDISASCGCTLPQALPSNSLKPGEEVRLAIKVQPVPYGSRDSVLTVRTDSADTPMLRVPIKLLGRKLAPPYLSLAPSEIRVESLAGELPPPRTFQVSTVEPPGEAWLTGFNVSSDDMACQPPRLVKEHVVDEKTVMRDYELEFQFLSESDSSGDQNCSLFPITRAEPTKPFPHISVIWQRVAAIRAAPSSILLTFSRDGESELSRKVALIAADDQEWEIDSLDGTESWLEARSLEAAQGSKHRQLLVSAKRPPDGESSPKDGVVRIRTTHEKCPEVVIHVTVVENRALEAP